MPGKWCPAPQYILRRQCVLRLLKGVEPGKVLEIGCAQGDMLKTLGALGFTGLGVDLSEEALSEARAGLAGLAGRLRVAKAGAELGSGPYDYVLALEVLEHMPDDLAALRQWRRHLRTGGRLIVSVPASPATWGALDEVAGHYRRYARRRLRRLLLEAGFRVEHLWCYGFPITNLTQRLSNRIWQRYLPALRGLGKAARTARSGLDRSAIRPFRFLWTNRLFRGIGTVQLLFRHTDWGMGYVARAQARDGAV